MYKDFFPPLQGGMTPPTSVVVVITRHERVLPEDVIAACNRHGATSQQSEGLCFWVVFEDAPRRAWPFTQMGLLSSADKDGYIKCNSYDLASECDRRKEVPSYLTGVGISAS